MQIARSGLGITTSKFENVHNESLQVTQTLRSPAKMWASFCFSMRSPGADVGGLGIRYASSSHLAMSGSVLPPAAC